MDCLVRYGEIALKGKNRPRFEDRLKANIVALARREGADCRVRKLSGRFLVTTDRALPLSRVFGLHSFSPCIVTGAAPAAIEAHLATLAPHVAGKRFRITATRAQPAGLSSTEMNRRFGAFIQEQVQCTVSLEAFDMNFGIEVIGDAAYIFTETQPGFGGLPVGIEGLAGLYLDGEAAVLAAEEQSADARLDEAQMEGRAAHEAEDGQRARRVGQEIVVVEADAEGLGRDRGPGAVQLL